MLGPATTCPRRGFGGGNSHQQPPSLAVCHIVPPSPAGPQGEAETTQRERSFQRCVKELESCWKSREVAGQNPSSEGAKGWWGAGCAMPLFFGHPFGGGEAKEWWGMRGGKGEGEGCCKKMDNFITTTFFWHCWGIPYFITNLQPVRRKEMWVKWNGETYL